LNTCTPDDLSMAADRFLAAVREDVVQTAHGPVAATITVGGVAAPRHARTVAEILAHAQESLDSAKARRRGSFIAYRPNIERETLRKENVHSTDKIVSALNERRILLAFEPVAATATRELGVDMIKIDGAFVQHLTRSEDDRVFVRTLIDLGRSLGLKTVAEWVQDEEAAAILADWGCDYLQGDLIGRASLERPWAASAPPPESAAR